MASLNTSRLIKLILLVAVLATLGIGLYLAQTTHTSPAVDNAKPKAVVLKIAVPDFSTTTQHSSANPIIDYIYVNKLLEKALANDHVQVEWHFFKGAGPAINEALANKQLDFAFLGDLALLIGKSNQIESSLIMATGRNIPSYLGVLPQQGYSSLDKLVGKKIALWQGTAYQLSFYRFIQRYGYTEKDFKIVNLDAAAANAALVAKQVDASWGQLSILALQQKAAVEIPLSTKDVADGSGSIQSGLIGRRDYIAQYPELTQKIANVVLAAAHWASQENNREELIQFISHNAGFSADLYRINLQHQDLNVLFSPLLDDYYLQHLQSSANLALASKLIRNKVDVAQWIEPKYLTQGLETLQYTQAWN
jgi:sulfonate transport system substrate-binding protein